MQKKYLVLILLLLTVFLSGCVKSNNQTQGQKPQPVHPKDVKREIILSKAQDVVVVYFATADHKNLVPVTIDVNPTQEMAKVATEKLLAGPSDETLQNPIPEGTKLKDLYKFDNIAYVDLTPEFLKAQTMQEAKMAVDALVLTLTEFTQVKSVQILIDGKVQTKPYGTNDISKALQCPQKINYYGENGKNVFKVYYADSNAMYMVPVTFATDEEVTPDTVLDKLLQDPPIESGLIRSLWKGTKLIDTKKDKDTLYVNLSKEALAYGGGAANEASLVNGLTLTLTDLPEIKKLQLLIEGKKPDYLPEGTDISVPWQRSEKINYFQKQ